MQRVLFGYSVDGATGHTPLRPASARFLAVVAGVPPAWVDLAADTAASTVLLAELGGMIGVFFSCVDGRHAGCVSFDRGSTGWTTAEAPCGKIRPDHEYCRD